MNSETLLKKARALEKYTSREFIQGIFTEFQELHGDRLYGEDEAIVGGVAFLNEISVTVIGIQKGKNLKENLTLHFGQAQPEGYRKALRLMKQAEKFQRPIITFVNTPGAFCGIEAEQRGQGNAIAENLLFLSQCKVPVISIIIGEGGSGGALALALGNEVWMLENTFYAVLSPEGFASILWKDANRYQEAADIMKINPQFLKKAGICDQVIPETKTIFADLKEKLSNKITELQQLSETELQQQRYRRFRKF